jgi:hypothetical protein
MKKILSMSVILLLGLATGVWADPKLPYDSTRVQSVPERVELVSEETGHEGEETSHEGGDNEKVTTRKNSTSDTTVGKTKGPRLNKKTGRHRIVDGGFRGWRRVR